MENLSISCRRRVIDIFSNLNELIQAAQKADAVVPPITIEVASKEMLESFVKEALSAFGQQTVVSHSFTCKLDKLGLSLPLKDSEIKGIEADEYPLTLTFNSFDEVKVFASAYDKATPVTRVTSKTIQERVKSNAESSQSKNRKLLYAIGAAVVALVIAIPLFQGVFSPKKSEVQNTAQNDMAGENYSWIIGTWSVDLPTETYGIRFDGDGKSGPCLAVEDGIVKQGTYSVNNNKITYKLEGESITTFIEIHPGHRLYAGDGYYYQKAN